MAGVMLITPITDNIKHEKTPKTNDIMYLLYRLTSDCDIKSYFAFYLILSVQL